MVYDLTYSQSFHRLLYPTGLNKPPNYGFPNTTNLAQVKHRLRWPFFFGDSKYDAKVVRNFVKWDTAGINLL